MTPEAGPVTERTRGRPGEKDIEDLAAARLDLRAQHELCEVQTEAVLGFLQDGQPTAVVMSFAVDEQGHFWFATVEGRRQVRGLDADPRVSVAVSSTGTSLPGRRMLALRGEAVVHRDRDRVMATVEWLAPRLAPEDPAAFVRLLDSPQRVVIEVDPTRVTASHDSTRLAGDGRGGRRGRLTPWRREPSAAGCATWPPTRVVQLPASSSTPRPPTPPAWTGTRTPSPRGCSRRVWSPATGSPSWPPPGSRRCRRGSGSPGPAWSRCRSTPPPGPRRWPGAWPAHAPGRSSATPPCCTTSQARSPARRSSGCCCWTPRSHRARPPRTRRTTGAAAPRSTSR